MLPADRKGCDNKVKKEKLEVFFQIVHSTYQLDTIDLANAINYNQRGTHKLLSCVRIEMDF